MERMRCQYRRILLYCYKFSEEKDEDNQSDAAQPKRVLDPYLHYYSTYHAHGKFYMVGLNFMESFNISLWLLGNCIATLTWWLTCIYTKLLWPKKAAAQTFAKYQLVKMENSLHGTLAIMDSVVTACACCTLTDNTWISCLQVSATQSLRIIKVNFVKDKTKSTDRCILF